MEENNSTDWNASDRTIVLMNTKFAPLVGILSTAFFLHSLAVPMTQNTERPDLAGRDMFIAYTLVALSYLSLGSLGYFGFMGT